MKKHNVLIVDDQKLTRQTLEYQIKKIPSLNVSGSVENGEDAIKFVEKEKPDIILMDIEMPKKNGIEATIEIKKMYPEIIVIILTSHTERENVINSFRSGANAYCSKGIKIEELKRVIDVTTEGGISIDTKIAEYIFDILRTDNETICRNKKSSENYNISDREKEVLKLVSDGLSNDEIAEKLFISKNTVKNHIASIISKLSVKDRTQAAIFALKNGIV